MRPTYFRILVLIILPILFYFHFRGLVFGEEGYLLNSASNILSGSFPFKDFYYSYNPLGLFVVSLAFLIFGESVFAARLLIFILSAFSIWIIFNIVKKITNKLLYSLLSIFVFAACGPAHVNFATPVTLSIPIILFIIYLILLSETNKNTSTHFLIGILTFLAFLTFQNFIVITLPIIVHYLLFRPDKSSLLKVIYGFTWGLIIFMTYLLSTNSFSSYLNNINLIYIKPGSIDISSFSNTNFFGTFLLSSFLLSSILTVLLLIYRKRYKLIYIPLVILSCFFALAFVFRDENLYTVLSLAGILIVIFINKFPALTIKLFSYLTIFTLVSTGFYTALLGNYYKSDIPLVEHNLYIGGKISLFVDRNFALEHKELGDLINIKAHNNDYIFIHSFSPLTYFIYDRKNPVPFDLFESKSTAYYNDLVIHSLVGKGVKLVLLTKVESQGEVEEFVEKRYILDRKIGRYSVYLEP